MKSFFINKLTWNAVLLILGICTITVYWFTSSGQTPYDYFIRLAASFLHGKYYLDNSFPWLNELIPLSNGKYAVVYPPAPALVALPFVAVFGLRFQQQILSIFMGAAAAWVWGMIAYRKSKNRTVSLWLFLLAAFGNIVWFMSASGSVWYLGQVSAYFFFSLGIYESLNRKRSWLTAIYVAMAIFSRLQVVLGLPLIFYLNRKVFGNLNKFIVFMYILGLFAYAYGLYNYLRFGSFTETGYSLIPGVLKEPWFNEGIFSINYISSHINVMFASFPIIIDRFPYIKPSWGGLSIWITSPAFIYILFANLKKHGNQLAWLSIILIALVVMSHGTTGFAQFGYRFAVDFYPFIFYLIANSVSKTGVKWHHWLLLLFSVVVNLWGVILINKFGLISF